MPTSNPQTWKSRRQQERLADVSANRLKAIRKDPQFTASGVDGTFLAERIRANPDWRPQPRPEMKLAHNRLPLRKQRKTWRDA